MIEYSTISGKTLTGSNRGEKFRSEKIGRKIQRRNRIWTRWPFCHTAKIFDFVNVSRATIRFAPVIEIFLSQNIFSDFRQV